MTDALVGTRFAGRFDVERPLAAGGMGAVYVAVQQPTGRKVALKVIKDKGATDPTLVARFQREADALASVSHPNIVTMFDSGVDDGVFFIVMELLSGQSLRKELEVTKRVPWPRAARIMGHVVRALSAVHGAGIVHRDLKPDNIFLVSSKGHVDFAKLLDFGIVRASTTGAGPDTPTETQNLTGTGGVIGTPGYLAPEQLRGEPTTAQSDLYAVGVILYEMVTGVFPFAAPTVQAMAIKQLIDPVAPPRSLVPELPVEAEQLIVALMDRDPRRRPSDADAVLAALDGAPLPFASASASTTGETRAAAVSTVGNVELATLPPATTSVSTGGFVVRAAAVGAVLLVVALGVAGVVDVVGKSDRRDDADRVAVRAPEPPPTTSAPPPEPTTATPIPISIPTTTTTPAPTTPTPVLAKPPPKPKPKPPEPPKTPEPKTPEPPPLTPTTPTAFEAPKPTWTPAQISAPLRANSAKLRACYVGESYFRAEGTLLPDGTLGPSLKIVRVTGGEASPGCLAGVLRGMRWVAIADAAPRDVTLPLTSAAW